jgi:hypothetical protein
MVTMIDWDFVWDVPCNALHSAGHLATVAQQVVIPLFEYP